MHRSFNRLFATLVLCTCAMADAADIVVTGGTLIDVSRAGRSDHDIANAVIVVHDGIISKVGQGGHVAIPAHAQVVDAKGRFIVPGLIDGFGSMRNPHFADAYLFDGVTTVYVTQAPAGLDGEQVIDATAAAPRVIRAAAISGYALDGSVPSVHPWIEHRLHDVPLSEAQLVTRIRDLSDQGVRGLLIGFDVLPNQVDVIVREAKRRHLAVSAEPVFTSYPQAISAGVGAMVRNDRYSTAIASADALKGYVDDPMGKGAGDAYRNACAVAADSTEVATYARQLKNSHSALMPILAIEATADDVNAANPWLSPSSVFVTPAELDDPVDANTGDRPFLKGSAERRERLQRCARHRQEIDARLHQLGATYLAGSGAPAYGIMPGGGMLLELQLLQHIGLTPREALAAATSNYSDVFGWTDVGKIETGRRGDIVIIDADPRRDTSALDHIASVVFDGRVVDRDALHAAALARHTTAGK